MERSILLTKRNILWNMAILLRVNGNIVGGFALQFAAFGQVDKFVPKIKLCPFLLQISSKLLGVTTCNTTTLFLMESFWTQRPKAHTVCLTVFVQIQVCSDQIYLTLVTFYISFAF